MSIEVYQDNGIQKTNSKNISEVFKKPHRDVIKAIKQLDCSDEFRARNFSQSSYTSRQNKKLSCVEMTRDGFTFLCMGFTGKRAAQWKEAYIDAFNQMEASINNFGLRAARLEAKGKELNEAGREWASLGHEVRRAKSVHKKEAKALMDDVQIKIDFKD